jgi:hypothetical protein
MRTNRKKEKQFCFLKSLERPRVGGVGVLKDDEIKLKEIEVSHTLGGTGHTSEMGVGRKEMLTA